MLKKNKSIKYKKRLSLLDFIIFFIKLALGLGVTLYFMYTMYYDNNSLNYRLHNPGSYAEKDAEQTKILNTILEKQKEINSKTTNKIKIEHNTGQ